MNKDSEFLPAASRDEEEFPEEPLFARALFAESRSAESMEGRGLTEENTREAARKDKTNSEVRFAVDHPR